MFSALSLCLFVCFVCLSVCLCAGYLKKLWTHWACDKDKLIRFWWNPNPATGIKKMILHHWKIGRKWYIARYFRKLWTDSDETWWTGWVCGKEKLNWFWWRSRSGSDYSNFKVIFHHWKMWPKIISIHPSGPHSMQSIGAAEAVSLAIGHNPGRVATSTQCTSKLALIFRPRKDGRSS